MTRLDLYAPVHKGLRALLFDQAALVARTDFANATEAESALTALGRACAFLAAHVEHEDRQVMPLVAKFGPELFADLQADHARVTGLEDEIRRLIERTATASAIERPALGRKLCERVTRFVAEQIVHMEREETLANRVLWAHCSDAELAELEGRIVGSIPPAELSDWLALMLPASNLGERAGLIGRMQAAVPAEVVEALTAEARRRMGPTEWAATMASVQARATAGAERSA